MKQAIRISMLVSALMINVSHPLFAAQPPAAKPAPAPVHAGHAIKAPPYGIYSSIPVELQLPISNQEIVQELIKIRKESGDNWLRLRGSHKATAVTTGILLPAANGSKGSIIVAGLQGEFYPGQDPNGDIIVMKFTSDAQGVYHIDRSFGKNIAVSGWRVINGIAGSNIPPEVYSYYKSISIVITPGNKPDEFIVSAKALAPPQKTRDFFMNDRGDIIKTGAMVK